MQLHQFNSLHAQVNAMGTAIQLAINQILQQKSSITIAVSGGTSPIPLFTHLANTKQFPWDKIMITLVDERIVAATNPDSNEFLVREYLLKNYAHKAQFIGIIDNLNKNVADLNIDIMLLGMGEDGHIASIFPNCNELSAALNLENQAAYIKTRPLVAKYERISTTLAGIVQVPRLILNIRGEDKLKILHNAIENNAYPIHYLLKARNDLDVYYTQ